MWPIRTVKNEIDVLRKIKQEPESGDNFQYVYTYIFDKENEKCDENSTVVV